MHDGKDKFLALENFGEKESKDKVITKILRGLHANAERTSLKEIGLSTPLGQFQSGEGGITLSDNTKIIYQSPTGLFERHVYLKDL